MSSAEILSRMLRVKDYNYIKSFRHTKSARSVSNWRHDRITFMLDLANDTDCNCVKVP